jgi:hypothetical protein
VESKWQAQRNPGMLNSSEFRPSDLCNLNFRKK